MAFRHDLRDRFSALWSQLLGSHDNGRLPQQRPTLVGLRGRRSAAAVGRVFARPEHAPAPVDGRRGQQWLGRRIEPQIEVEEEPIVSAEPAALSSAAFAGMTQKLRERKNEMYLGNGNITLEQLVRELLKPMLQEWLDENLPPLVERLVHEEIKRIAREAV